MDRIFSDEEKVRRAIEISQRRNQNYYTKNATRVNVNNKKNYKLFKKMILQIIICLLIYVVFHLISTTNYAFSSEVLRNTNNILSYDINLENLYKNFQNFFITNFNKQEEIVEANSIMDNISETINTINNTDNNENKTVDTVVIQEKEVIEKNTYEDKEKDSMKKDAEKAKKMCKFQKPLSGTITSEFGEREATIEGMTTDHKGIDIAQKSGTNIKAATSGTVSVAEQNSEYGKFIKIEQGNIMTVYAHCKTLKVKAGDKIKIGQTIATVGSTGNSTGPHLHFEIRLENRYINPRLVINF